MKIPVILVTAALAGVVVCGKAEANQCVQLFETGAGRLHATFKGSGRAGKFAAFRYAHPTRVVPVLRQAIHTLSSDPHCLSSPDVADMLLQTYQFLGVAYADAHETSSEKSAFDAVVKLSRGGDLVEVDSLLRKKRWRDAFKTLRNKLFGPAGGPLTPSAIDAFGSERIADAITQAASGKFTVARESFVAFLGRAPTLQEPHYFLGITDLALGHRQDAIAELEMVLRTVDPSPEGSVASSFSLSAMDLLRGLL